MNLLKTCVSIVFHMFRQAKKKKKKNRSQVGVTIQQNLTCIGNKRIVL